MWYSDPAVGFLIKRHPLGHYYHRHSLHLRFHFEFDLAAHSWKRHQLLGHNEQVFPKIRLGSMQRLFHIDVLCWYYLVLASFVAEPLPNTSFCHGKWTINSNDNRLVLIQPLLHLSDNLHDCDCNDCTKRYYVHQAGKCFWSGLCEHIRPFRNH